MKVVTAVVNNPIFIELQYHSLKKYFKGDYEFIVFNDAKDFPDFTNGNDATIKTQIEDMCNKLNIKCINIPNSHHKTNMVPSVRTADSLNYILSYQKNNPDKYLLFDSDMFLINHFDIDKYSQYDCAILLQSRNNFTINYLWNGIYYFDFTKMKNIELLNWSMSPYCDTGGMTQYWLKSQMGNTPIPSTDDLRWKKNQTFHTNDIYFIQHLWSHTWDINELPTSLQSNTKLIEFIKNDPRNTNGKFFCEIYDDVILHYRAGGNWRHEGLDLHRRLTNKLKDVLM